MLTVCLYNYWLISTMTIISSWAAWGRMEEDGSKKIKDLSCALTNLQLGNFQEKTETAAGKRRKKKEETRKTEASGCTTSKYSIQKAKLEQGKLNLWSLLKTSSSPDSLFICNLNDWEPLQTEKKDSKYVGGGCMKRMKWRGGEWEKAGDRENRMRGSLDIEKREEGWERWGEMERNQRRKRRRREKLDHQQKENIWGPTGIILSINKSEFTRKWLLHIIPLQTQSVPMRQRSHCWIISDYVFNLCK